MYSNVKTKTNSSFGVKFTERSNHSFLPPIWWTRFSDICTIIELKEFNWLCKHVKNVRSSQPCILMNFCTEFSKAQVLPCERWILAWLILEKIFLENFFLGKFCALQFPLLIHNQLNSLSLEDKMDDIEDTILLLWLFRKTRKSCRLIEKNKQRKFWVRPIFRERKLKWEFHTLI